MLRKDSETKFSPNTNFTCFTSVFMAFYVLLKFAVILIYIEPAHTKKHQTLI